MNINCSFFTFLNFSKMAWVERRLIRITACEYSIYHSFPVPSLANMCGNTKMCYGDFYLLMMALRMSSSNCDYSYICTISKTQEVLLVTVGLVTAKNYLQHLLQAYVYILYKLPVSVLYFQIWNYWAFVMPDR